MIKRINKRGLRESNDYADEPIVMYYKGKKIFEGDSDRTYKTLKDLMYSDNEFYLSAKEFLEDELGFDISDIDDCAYTLSDEIYYASTFADSIDSFYIPFRNFEAFFKADEVKESICRTNRKRPIIESAYVDYDNVEDVYEVAKRCLSADTLLFAIVDKLDIDTFVDVIGQVAEDYDIEI